MKNNYVLLIVGKSGSGKSTLCKYMEETYGLKQVRSYTTRPCRGSDDDTHIFVNDEKFDTLTDDMCAYTLFDGHRYCATNRQVDECDLYVIDVAGIEYFLKTYKGKKIPIVVHIEANDAQLYHRMLKRGDKITDIMRRMEHDKIAFLDVNKYATETCYNSFPEDIETIGNVLYHKYFKE